MIKNRGIITTYVLVFAAIFLILLSGLFSFVLLQLRHSAERIAWNQALHITEAGINYYQWCLNNEVQDLCLTEKYFLDPAGVPIGRFSLEVIPTIKCGKITQVEIISTGWTNEFPEIRRSIRVLYARESVAKFVYLINDGVWAGADREIKGLYHSNMGVRMDGENYSLVTSAVEEWICTARFGCDPCPIASGCRIEGGNCICPGVFTTTSNSRIDLFSFPVPRFDFEGIIIDLAKIKNLTQPHPQQFYWPPAVDIHPEGKGYRVVFLDNGTFEVWAVTELDRVWAYSLTKGWHWHYAIIEEKHYQGTFSINPACPVIFIEDNLWVEGIVKGRVTIVSANLINPGVQTDVILSRNIDYTTLDGSDALAIIGQRNILIGPDSPNNMTIRGIFIAQKGRFSRNHYLGNIRESLRTYGSVISNGRVGTRWSSAGAIVSGYKERRNHFDSKLIFNPPPFVPNTIPEFRIVNWQEVE